METLKQSSGILSATACAGVLALAFYTHRRCNGMQKEIDDLVKMVADFQKRQDTLVNEVVGRIQESFNNRMQQFTEEFSKLQTLKRDFDALRFDFIDTVEQLSEELKEKGIEVTLDLFKPKRKRPSQSSNRRVQIEERSSRLSRDESDDEDDALELARSLRNRRRDN